MNIECNKKWITLFLFLITGYLLSSCNQQEDDLLFHGNNETKVVKHKERKVLYIMLTGARGDAVKNANTSTLSRLSKHAIYTYDGIADYKEGFDTMTVANGWANMLTGALQSKTQADNSDWSQVLLDKYPTFVSRIDSLHPKWGTSVFCSSDELKNKLFSESSNIHSFSGDDQATVDAVKNYLASNKDSKIVLCQLSGIEKAGESNGFDESDMHYMSAIKKADEQIGIIMNALKSRKDYANEDWMVIVASGIGGTNKVVPVSANENIYDDPIRNTFVMFYNPDFQSFLVSKPENSSGYGHFEGETVRLFGHPVSGDDGLNAVVEASDQSMFDVGSGALTVECKVKFHPRSDGSYSYNYPPFITKTFRANYNNTAGGWSLYRNGNSVQAYVNSDSGDDIFLLASNDNLLGDGVWHTLALKIWREGDIFHVKLFVDGILEGVTQSKFSSGAYVGGNEKLTFGYAPNVYGDQYINMNIADVRIWEVALPDNIIKEYACYPGMLPTTHPYLNDLVGFWPCTDGSGGVFHDVLDPTGDHDAVLHTSGSAKIDWKSFSDVSNNVCPTPDPEFYKLVPNSVDIPFEIYHWLGMKVPEGWNLDGKAWAPSNSSIVHATR